MSRVAAARAQAIGLPSARREGGFTLVEVLVAMAILAVGIYAAIAIFPTGFAAMEYNRQQTLAARLAQSEIQRWKDRTGSLPDAIVSRSPGGEVNVNYSLDRLVFDSANPNWQPDATWQPRYIIGETVVVPSTSTVPEYRVPLYVLTMSPLDRQQPGLVVYSTAYHELSQRSDLSSEGNQHQFYVDAGTGRLYFDLAEPSRQLKIEYAYYQATREGGVITGQRIVQILNDPEDGGAAYRVLAPADNYRLTLSKAPGGWAADPEFVAVVPGSVRVFDAFTQVDDPDEPGEFGLGTSAGQPSAVALLTGVLRFPQAEAGNTVKVDYQVADWQILREERTLGEEGRIQVLGAAIKSHQDFTPPRTRSGQYLDQEGATRIDVVAVNVETGEALYGSDRVRETALGPYTGAFRVDYLAGVCVFVEEGRGTSRVGATWRIMYRSLDDWTLQVNKAAEYYVPEGTVAAREDQLYRLTGYDLNFRECEWGKAVAVDYTYSYRPHGSSDLPTRVSDHNYLQTIPANGQVRLRVEVPAGNDLVELVINSVRGVSLRTRAIWISRGQAQAEGGELLAERMDHQDVQTYLVRPE